jgi:hypothetical protein
MWDRNKKAEPAAEPPAPAPAAPPCRMAQPEPRTGATIVKAVKIV